MKDKIYNMIRFLTVLSAMITAIGAGLYAIVYALIHAWMFVLIFIVGAAGLAFGLFTLNIVAEKLR
tara:strand:+ start:68 stop:265 length:198 start_codon:yes stop_codon:yes gene_type:complete